MNFTVYRSSAGSGKTFTLVKEYLKIALTDEADPPQKFRKILAITFTNKAAQEMKDRVIKALKELAAQNTTTQSDLATILVEELKLDTATLAKRSENLLRAILHQYGDFAIGTIDAFTHRIVRNFAYDLGLPVNFEIETEKDARVQKAVDELLSRIGIDDDLTDTLLRFAEEKADDEKTWQIDKELKATAEILLEENGTIQAGKLKALSMGDFKKMREQLYVLEKSFENRIAVLAQSALDTINKAGLEERHFNQGDKGIARWFQKQADGEYKRLLDFGAYVESAVIEGKWISGAGKTQKLGAIIDSIVPELEAKFHAIQEIAVNEYPLYITRCSIRKHIYSLSVLNELEKTFEEFRNQDNVLHISEFNHIISKVVSEQPVPFIFEKLGARYSHFLIDEFQDTSGLQWQNILPLIENGLAENNFSMVVGDAKQAIYRWRGGDIEQFIALPAIKNASENPLFADREQSLKRNYKEHPLAKNFRSKREVIEFNNGLFLSLTKLLHPEYQNVYNQVSQTVKAGNEGGYVELRFPERLGKKIEKDDSYTTETIALVRDLLAQGWKANEIALLTRTNGEGSTLATALIGEGIDVLSSDSLLLKNSPLIGCLVSLLFSLEHPEDRISLADIATYLNKTGRGNYPIHTLRTTNDKLENVLSKYGITEDLSALSIFPLYQQCESLVRILFPEELKNAWVIFFLDELLKFGTTRSSDRQSFFAWWENRSRNASVVVTEGTDAVRVMTIHKSKGLEFPVVILPYLNWAASREKPMWIEPNDLDFPNLPAALVHSSKLLQESTVAPQYEIEKSKRILDQMNVLYVACTRAVNQLYILSERIVDKKTPDPLNVAEWLNNVYSQELASSNTIQLGTQELPQRVDKILPEFTTVGAGEGKWIGKIRVKKYSEDSWGNTSTESSRSRGILLHHLLQEIKSQDQIETVLKSAVNSGLIPSSDYMATLELLNGVLTNPELAPYYTNENDVRTEHEILVPNEKSSRPDRVILNEKEATIIDYKTGVESEDHINQIKHYRSLLQRMGYSPVVGKLVYLTPLKIVTV